MTTQLKQQFKTVFFLFIAALSNLVSAQNFAVGSKSFTLTDPDRNNRSIPIKVYYPATTSGADQPWAQGTFPVVIFGHGFVMSYSAYQNIWENQVPFGYVYVMLDTENGFNVSHANFGLDFRFVSNYLNSQSEISTSFFHQKVNSFHVFMGHSMGGGAAFLGAQNFDACKAVIGLSPAETNPSAAAAAALLTQPCVVVAASGDAVTPPANHQIPIYNSAAQCKYYISLTGGAHCYYANTDFACDFGETTAGSQPTISRFFQQTISYNIIKNAIDLFRFPSEGLLAYFNDFVSSLNNENIATFEKNCDQPVYIKASPFDSELLIYPNPQTQGQVFFNQPVSGIAALSDISGKIIQSLVVKNDVSIKLPDNLSNGIYFLILRGNNGKNARFKVCLQR